MKIKCIFLALFFLHACTEGETADIYEFVRATDLGIEEIRLEKEHNDYLRQGREIQVRAVARLSSGEDQDITRDVRWFSGSDAVLSLKDKGVFLAHETPKTEVVSVKVEFAGLRASETITVSVAKLNALEVGFARSGVVGQCQIASNKFDISQCSAKKLCALGSYQNETPMRDETRYLKWLASTEGLIDNGYLINAKIDMSSGGASEVLYGKLDGISSNNFSVNHIADLEELVVVPSDNKVVMGQQLTLAIPSLPNRIQPYLDWRAESFSAGQPEPDVEFAGNVLKAHFEKDFVSDWSQYGVNVQGSCSGFLSSPVAILIESDVSSMKIVDDLESHDLQVGDDRLIELVLEAKNKNGTAISIKSNEVIWFICDLLKPACTAEDKKAEAGSLFEFSVEDEVPGEVRIEAVFHGRKAVREDFRFVE